MVFEPALTRQDWLGLCALAALALLLLGFGAFVLSRALRRSVGAFLSVAAVLGVCGLAMHRLVSERIQALCAIEFADGEVIVHGVTETVRLPLDSDNEVSVDRSGFSLVSGDVSARLPEGGAWAADELVVNAGYLAREFAGRSR